jgi:hypothetical protein
MIAVNELAHGVLNPPSQQLLEATNVPHPDPRDIPSSAAPTSASPAPPVGAAAPVSTTAPPAPGTLLTSADGTVTASCQPGGAYLQYWSPNPGFESDDVARGPAPVASITFEGSGGGVVMHVSCNSGVPVAQVTSVPPEVGSSRSPDE